MTESSAADPKGSTTAMLPQKRSCDELNEITEEFVRLNVYGDHEKAVSSVKYAPSRLCKGSGTLVASASASATISLWDLKQEFIEETVDETKRRSLTPATVCVGHSRGINEICWNPTSPLLASASDDKTVRIWDATTGESLSELKGHENFVFCVDQQHAMVVSGSFDETVKLWDLRTGDCVCTLPAHSDPVTSVHLNRDGTCVCTASHDGLIRIWDVSTGT
jgi:COMPASS component SWD3